MRLRIELSEPSRYRQPVAALKARLGPTMEMHTTDTVLAVHGIWAEPKHRTPGLRKGVATGLKVWRAAARRRREASRFSARLSDLDDRLLRDIGLYLHQIDDFADHGYCENALSLADDGGAK